MNCPTCKRTNPERAAFCGYCGSQLASPRTCSACGTDNPAQARFCHRCGTELTPAPAGAAAASSSGERKQQTIAPLVPRERVFVGRQGELREAERAVDHALAGRGELLLIEGEGGIGKTRTAEQIAAYARHRRALILQGRSYEAEGAPAYWPWVQVIRCYLDERGVHELLSQLGNAASHVAQIVPEIREKAAQLPALPSLGPQQARFRLFDAVASLLVTAARNRALVIILDDIHWADKPSLLLLQFLANEIGDAPILLLATHRPVDGGRHHPLAQTLSELGRKGLGGHICLRGLPEQDVAQFMAVATGDEPPASLVKAVSAFTEGNPFFLTETLSLLAAERDLGAPHVDGSWELRVPEGIRDVIRRRLQHLSPGCNAALTAASVMGRDFRVDVLGRTSELAGERLVEQLQEAITAGIVTHEDATESAYRFSHVLIRDALYDEIDIVRRVRLHAEIGEALEELYGDQAERHYAELAYHFVEAARGGDATRAVHYSAVAGARAARLLAYEEAALHYERALEVAEVAGLEDTARCDLLRELGDAQWRSGETRKARSTYQKAADLALQLQDAQRLAEAALGYGVGLGGFGFVERSDGVLIGLLEEALQSVSSEDSELRVRLLARLAVELYYTPFRERRATLSEEAVEMARRLDDPAAELIAVYSRHWSMLGPDGLEERLAAAEEIFRLAEQVGDREMAFRGHHFRISALLELGRIEEVDPEIANAEKLAKELRQPLYRWQVAVFRATRALMEGRFEEGAQLAQEALALGEHGYKETALVLFGVQTFMQHWGQGRLEDLQSATESLVEQYPWSTWRASVAALYTELGRASEARKHFEVFARNDFADVPRDGNWLITICLLGLVSAFLGDRARSSTLYDLISPYRERAVVGSAATVCIGSAASFLAVLAASLQRWDDAVAHFETGLKLNSEMGNVPFLAWTLYEYARMWVAKGSDADLQEALRLVNRALQMTLELGMKSHTERLLMLKLEVQGVASEDISNSIDAVSLAVQRERPDLGRHASREGEATILLTDIEGSTAMTERLGERRAHELLLMHNTIVREEIYRHGGAEVKALGDGFLIVFSDPVDALACAVATQRRFADYNESHTDEPVRVRVGLHRGAVIRENEEFYGRNMILATRIANEARGEEILVSAAVKEASEAAGRFSFDEGRDVELKGMAGNQRVYGVRWRELARETAGVGGRH